MKNMDVTDTFMIAGGTEAAPMSTTGDLDISLGYSGGAQRLLFKLPTRSFMERGASLGWISTFPDEDECLYPSLTFLQPTGRVETIRLAHPGAPRGGAEFEFRVVEVQPHFST